MFHQVISHHRNSLVLPWGKERIFPRQSFLQLVFDFAHNCMFRSSFSISESPDCLAVIGTGSGRRRTRKKECQFAIEHLPTREMRRSTSPIHWPMLRRLHLHIPECASTSSIFQKVQEILTPTFLYRLSTDWVFDDLDLSTSLRSICIRLCEY